MWKCENVIVPACPKGQEIIEGKIKHQSRLAIGIRHQTSDINKSPHYVPKLF
jgi:hypothetical protein